MDSGADFSLIPFKFGRFIRLDEKKDVTRKIGGVGGLISVRMVSIPMKVNGVKFDCTIAWAQIENVPFLLGRESVFDNFDIEFLQRNRITSFKR